MNFRHMNLLDLPSEILLLILKKLNNIDVLYSMFGIDHQHDILLTDNTFTNTLNFVLTTTNDDITPFPDGTINRFCKNILPKIDQSIKYLILDYLSMKIILQSANYPNLTQLKLFNFDDNIVEEYFNGK